MKNEKEYQIQKWLLNLSCPTSKTTQRILTALIVIPWILMAGGIIAFVCYFSPSLEHLRSELSAHREVIEYLMQAKDQFKSIPSTSSSLSRSGSTHRHFTDINEEEARISSLQNEESEFLSQSRSKRQSGNQPTSTVAPTSGTRKCGRHQCSKLRIAEVTL